MNGTPALNSRSVERLIGEVVSQAELFAIDLSMYRAITLPALVYLTIAAFQWRAEKGETESVPLRVSRGSALEAYILSSRAGNLVGPDGFEPFRLSVSPGRRVATQSVLPFIVPFKPVEKRTSKYADAEDFCSNFINQLASLLPSILATRLRYSETDVRQFWSPHKEMLFNIFDHSESWGFCVIEAAKAGLVVSYADLGIGIPATLLSQRERLVSSKSEPWTDGFAIERAFEFAVSRHFGQGRGTGLTDTLRFVREHNGSLECRSGAGLVRFGKDGVTRSVVAPLVGTQISMYLPRVE